MDCSRSVDAFWRQIERSDTIGGIEQVLDRLDVAQMVDDALRGGDPAVRSIFQDAHRHPNGFLKATLRGSGRSGRYVRLHLWRPTDEAHGEPDIHDHRWSFSSRVLFGALCHRTFVAEMAADGSHHHYRHRAPRSREFDFQLVGRSSLHEQKADLLAAGSVYGLGHETLHRVEPTSASDLVATLVIEHPERREDTNVFSRVCQRSPSSALSRTCDWAGLRVHLHELRDHLPGVAGSTTT
ncbi:hypothetical protein [Actinomycetospora sp. CA-084318]|uniref:hypothetical protein n=1 Tax=Actinomycetospora sp. CA-084318 TaxID=3239892 RepID=UPI003D96C4D2